MPLRRGPWVVRATIDVTVVRSCYFTISLPSHFAKLCQSNVITAGRGLLLCWVIRLFFLVSFVTRGGSSWQVVSPPHNRRLVGMPL